MVRAFIPQSFPGHLDTNTNYPPQAHESGQATIDDEDFLLGAERDHVDFLLGAVRDEVDFHIGGS